MKRRLISVVLFAVLAAAVSSALLYKIISGTTTAKSKPTTAIVLVASRDLDAGAMVGDSDVRPAEFPATEGSHWLAQRSDVVGRALLTPLAKDEPFAETRLAAKGAGAGLASRIPRGMRMVAVHVDELTGLSRFILSGMHVDVISTGNSAGIAGQGMVARTILQDVEVFSTGDASHDPKAAATTSTPVFNLLVTPQQAETLSQAMATTRIELVLRNPLDKGSVISEVIPQIKLPEIPAPPKIFSRPVRPELRRVPENVEKVEKKVEPPPPPPALPTVEVIHGTKRTVNPVAVSPPGSEPNK
jgi:pilus assembly protein CpaB